MTQMFPVKWLQHLYPVWAVWGCAVVLKDHIWQQITCAIEETFWKALISQ
jgi:hypothetical protein